jgi:hypothetical protein
MYGIPRRRLRSSQLTKHPLSSDKGFNRPTSGISPIGSSAILSARSRHRSAEEVRINVFRFEQVSRMPCARTPPFES